MLNFTKIFRSKKKEAELANQDIVEANPPEQDEQNSEDKSYELPSAGEGQVTVHFTGASPADGGLIVGFFASNGLSQNVKFETVPLVLIDSERRVLARQSFDGETIGEIVGGSTKACVVRFKAENVLTQDIPEDAQICFDLPAEPPQSRAIQYQVLPENITPDQQRELERILRELPPMKQGEVNFSPLSLQVTDYGDLLTTVIIRNFSDKVINLEKMPLVVYDAQKAEVARGLFEINGLSINPFKALLWTFDFGALSQETEFDLSSWHINLAQ